MQQPPALRGQQAIECRCRTKNCTALNKRYHRGVGKWGARDNTSGTPVTTFKRSNILYRQNRELDHDKDGIACEKQ
jgi:Excalibur calcium-binding domain